MQQLAILHLPVLILVVFLIGNLQTASCLGNATRIGDISAAEEEFSMESETNRRILQEGKTITYPVANNPSRPYCDSQVYGSCIGEKSKNYKDRPCNHQNTCDRPGS